VGTTSPGNKHCGDLTSTRLFVGNLPPAATDGTDLGIFVQRTTAETVYSVGTLSSTVVATAPAQSFINGWNIAVSDLGSTSTTIAQTTAIRGTVVHADSTATSVLTAYFGTTQISTGLMGASVRATVFRGLLQVTGTGAAIATEASTFFSGAPTTVRTITTFSHYNAFDVTSIATGNVTDLYGYRCGAQTAGTTSNVCFFVDSNSATTPVLAAGTSRDTTLFRVGSGVWATGTSQDVRVGGYGVYGSTSAPAGTTDGDLTAIRWLSPTATDYNIYSGVTSAIAMKHVYVASYVNGAQTTPSIAAGTVDYGVQGTDTNIEVRLVSKGSDPVTLVTGSTSRLTCLNGGCNVANYFQTGALTAPANTADGIITTPSANPGSQAFGAVTASGASGLLTFTTTLAAATCATATVTNTKVATSTLIFLTIQGYSGTEADIMRVKRLNTAGSSSGSWVLQLCNDNLVGALSGSIYIGYDLRN